MNKSSSAPFAVSAPPFDQLAALVAFARHGSVQAAAAQLGVSQPAISNLLSRLDAKYSQPLFAVEGTRKTLTAHGRALYESVQGPVAELMSSFDRFQRFYGSPENRRIRLAARREVLKRVVSGLKYQGTIECTILGSDAILEALHARQCDVAVVQRDLDDPTFFAREIFASDVVLALPAKSRVKKLADALTPDFFATESFVAYRHDHPFLSELSSSVDANLIPNHVTRLCEDWELVAKMVADGSGFSVMPKTFAGEGIKTFDLTPRYLAPATFKVVCLKDFLVTPGIAEFLDELSDIW